VPKQQLTIIQTIILRINHHLSWQSLQTIDYQAHPLRSMELHHHEQFAQNNVSPYGRPIHHPELINFPTMHPKGCHNQKIYNS
jgi:hypothetical protein